MAKWWKHMDHQFVIHQIWQSQWIWWKSETMQWWREYRPPPLETTEHNLLWPRNIKNGFVLPIWCFSDTLAQNNLQHFFFLRTCFCTYRCSYLFAEVVIAPRTTISCTLH
jgi:hypothetical protein